MDKNTTTGLILIGAVIIAFMFLNKPAEKETSSNPATTEQKNSSRNDIDSQPESVLNINSDNSTNESINSDLSSDSISMEESLEEIENRKEIYGIFYNAAVGIEKDYALENDKIKLSFSNKGAKITKVEMVEKDTNGTYLYRTHKDFVSDTNLPMALFEKETSSMNLTLVDAEKVIPISTENLYFQLIKQNDSCLVFRADAGADDKYLEFIYCLPFGKHEVEFNINYHKMEYDIKPSVDLSWSMLGLSTEKLAEGIRNFVIDQNKLEAALAEKL